MEVKKEVKSDEKKSSLILENRKKLSLNGVVEVISFDESRILLNTSLGILAIKGQGLKMNKLDVQNGDIQVSGTIDSFSYSGTQQKKDNESILKKLFK